MSICVTCSNSFSAIASFPPSPLSSIFCHRPAFLRSLIRRLLRASYGLLHLALFVLLLELFLFLPNLYVDPEVFVAPPYLEVQFFIPWAFCAEISRITYFSPCSIPVVSFPSMFPRRSPIFGIVFPRTLFGARYRVPSYGTCFLTMSFPSPLRIRLCLF